MNIQRVRIQRFYLNALSETIKTMIMQAEKVNDKYSANFLMEDFLAIQKLHLNIARGEEIWLSSLLSENKYTKQAS